MTEQATDFVDYYAVLEIRETADSAAIEKAISDLQRIWRSRQNSPDPKRRIEAEEMMRTLEAADSILTDKSKRRTYDGQRRALRSRPTVVREAAPTVVRTQQQRPTVPVQRPVSRTEQSKDYKPRPVNGPDSSQWLTQARELLIRGANEAARVAARRAVDATPGDDNAWAILGDSFIQLGRPDEAETALKEAVTLNPSAANRVNLAKCRMVLGDYKLAFESLNAAYKREPDNVGVKDALVQCYIESGNSELALGLAENLAAQFPTHKPFQRQLAWVLYKTTMGELTETSPGLFLITSREQAEAVRSKLGRAWNLKFDDPPLRNEIQKWYHVGKAATERKFASPGGGPLFAWVLALVAGALFLLSVPWFGAAYLIGYAITFYLVAFTPQWGLNHRNCEQMGVTKWGV